MIIINGNEEIVIQQEKGKSVVECWLDYARKSQREYEELALGTQTKIWTQKHNGEFYIEFQVGNSENAINLSSLSNKELMQRLNGYYTEINTKGVDSFIKAHEEEFV